MNGSPQVIGRYVVRERLGQGGMGVLYLALDPAIDRLVAVKLLGVQGPELRERFVREAGLAGRLQHPNIVTVFDVGTHEGQPFIAMEYIPGETLGEIIQRRATLALRRRLELIVEACQGLAFAHRHGIVHRDVKPANLMVSRDSGSLKVLDFGIARGMDSSLTQAGMVMGTPNYMSPEQLEGRALDHRSDVFALGLVLYEILGYRQAFAGDTPQAVWRQIVHEQPVSILEINPNLDSALVGIIDRAVAKRVEDRYPDLDTLRTDLLRVIHRLQSMQAGDTLIEALPVAPPSQARRPDFARLAERRAAQIVTHLRNAEAALARQDLEAAQEAAEEAALLDTNDPRVLVLLERIRQGLDTREVSGLVAEANDAIRNGSLTSAAGLISRALQMMPAHPDALALRVTLQQAIEARERNQERARAISRALEQGEAQFAAGALEAALRATSEALGYEPGHVGALELKARVQDAVRARLDDILREARAEVAAQRLTAALRRLEQTRLRDERIDELESEVRAAVTAAMSEETAVSRPVLTLPTTPPPTTTTRTTPAQPLPAAPVEAALSTGVPVAAAVATPVPAAPIPAGPVAADPVLAGPVAADPVAAGPSPTSPAPTNTAPTNTAPTNTGAEPALVLPIIPPAPAMPSTPAPALPSASAHEETLADSPALPPVSRSVAVATPPGNPSARMVTSSTRATNQSGSRRLHTASTPATPTTGSRTIAASIKPEQRRAQAQDYLERARAHLAVGDFARSLSLVDAALALDPTRPEAHDLRRHIDQAWAANELGRPARARGASI